MKDPTRSALLLLAAFAFSVPGTAGLHAASAPRPNIVMIVADDLGFSDLGCYGGEIRTPNLDRLAAEGLRFTQFYNCAVCHTTRASMMTGLNPRFGRGGPRGNASPLLRPNMVTIAEALGQAGYASAMSGKWHLGFRAPTRPIDRGFEEYYGVMAGAFNFFDPTKPDPSFVMPVPAGAFVHNDRSVESVPPDYYSTDAFTDHAIGSIRRLARGDRPFFLHLAYNAPHYPLHAPPEDIARYRGRYDQGYTVLREARRERLVELGVIPRGAALAPPDRRLGEMRNDYGIPNWENVDQPAEARLMEIYAAMVDRMDRGIGRVLDALRESGVEDNTLVLFFSDNGGCAGLPVAENMGPYFAYNAKAAPGSKDSYLMCGPGWAMVQSAPFRRYKTWTYEGGIATPLIVRWPKRIAANTWTQAFGHVVDLMPTFLELAGAAYPRTIRGEPTQPLEGASLAPILRGGPGDPLREQGWYLVGNRAYRKGKWKAVWGVTSEVWELYDLQADRTETRDRAADHPEILRELSAAWQHWAERTEAMEDSKFWILPVRK